LLSRNDRAIALAPFSTQAQSSVDISMHTPPDDNRGSSSSLPPPLDEPSRFHVALSAFFQTGPRFASARLSPTLLSFLSFFLLPFLPSFLSSATFHLFLPCYLLGRRLFYSNANLFREFQVEPHIRNFATLVLINFKMYAAFESPQNVFL